MVYIADGAKLVGDIHFDEDCSVWYNAVLRGDSGSLTFGKRVNIQDNCTVHSGKGYVVQIGDDVTVGHKAILHGCKIGSHGRIELPNSSEQNLFLSVHIIQHFSICNNNLSIKN